jgi:hypothetical protein
MPFSVGIFWCSASKIFAGAGHLLARLLPKKLRQQNLRCASKI